MYINIIMWDDLYWNYINVFVNEYIWEKKKGNKMLEVRRGWDGKKLLLFSLLIYREWKKKMLVYVIIRVNW